VVATEVWRSVPRPIAWVVKKFMLSPEQGARSMIKAATAVALSTETGQYYDADGSSKRGSDLANDPALAEELWARSAQWAGLTA
jgi:retinol dehydrogenase 12